MAQSSFQGFLSPRPNKGGTNTGDATATAGDIGAGKTAYAVGVKVVGTGANAKNYASGSITNTSATLNFTAGDGTVPNLWYVNVTGLNFPNGIGAINIFDGAEWTTYSANSNLANSSKIYSSSLNKIFRAIPSASITNTSFLLPVGAASTVYTYEVWGI